MSFSLSASELHRQLRKVVKATEIHSRHGISSENCRELRTGLSTSTRTPKMSGSRRSFFPFDGECDLSRDADLTITFSEGNPLKAHSQHLKQASVVLKSALEDRRHVGALDVGDDSREAWLLLLNLVHPGRRITGPSSHECIMLEKMVGLSVSKPFNRKRMYVASYCGLGMQV